jgi:hypothetical protein
MEVLVQLGLGDSTVTTIGGRIYARIVVTTLLKPSIFDISEMNSAYGPIYRNDQPFIHELHHLISSESSDFAKRFQYDTMNKIDSLIMNSSSHKSTGNHFESIISSLISKGYDFFTSKSNHSFT